jgi:hypothetical protein
MGLRELLGSFVALPGSITARSRMAVAAQVIR